MRGKGSICQLLEEIKVLRVVLDWRITFSKHVSAVACTGYSSHSALVCWRQILHRHWPVYSQILQWCASTYTIRKLQLVQNDAAQIVLQSPRWTDTSRLLPVQQRIDYKLTLLTFKIRSTSIPSYSRRERTSTTCETDQPLHCCADQNNNRKASNLLHGTSNLKLTAKDSCLIVTLSPLLNLS